MTPFGKFMRNLRLDKGLMLKDCADALEVTSAYLSALEHGKKGAPNSQFVDRIVREFRLGPEEVKEMKKAVRDSCSRIDIPAKATPFAFETANAFARRLSSLTEDQLRRIRAVMGDGEGDE